MEKPKINIDIKICLSCGGCISVCPQDALYMKGLKAHLNDEKCIRCGICYKTCPIGAIQESNNNAI